MKQLKMIFQFMEIVHGWMEWSEATSAHHKVHTQQMLEVICTD